MKFGHWAVAPEDESIPAWGARAILNRDRSFELLWDRQTMRCEGPLRKVLSNRINTSLPTIGKAVKKLFLEQDKTYELHNDQGLIVKGRPAGGYLYLIAWLDNTSLPESDYVWTGDEPPAEPGSDIVTPLGPATVHGYGVSEGLDKRYLGVNVWLHSPPDWFVKDAKRTRGGSMLAQFFGAELGGVS